MNTKTNNGIDISTIDYKILASSQNDNFLYYDAKLQGLTFPGGYDIDVIFKKFTINEVQYKWRLRDNLIYQLTIKETRREYPEEYRDILYKYIWKTLLQEKDSGLIRLSYPNNSELYNIEKYLFSNEFCEVGIALIDDLMRRLREDYEIKKEMYQNDTPLNHTYEKFIQLH